MMDIGSFFEKYNIIKENCGLTVVEIMRRK